METYEADLVTAILDQIIEGRVDNNLNAIILAAQDRQKALTGATDPGLTSLPLPSGSPIESPIRRGDTIKVTGKLRPNYLLGHTFVVVKTNPKTIVIDVPNEPQYRRFAGSEGVRIPRNAVVKVVA